MKKNEAMITPNFRTVVTSDGRERGKKGVVIREGHRGL